MKAAAIICLFTATLAVIGGACVPAPPPGLPAVIPVGCIMATASAPAWGPNLVKAAQLAVKEINDRGGIEGKKLDLVIEDEGPTPATSLFALHKLIENSKVQVVIGGTTSDAALQDGPYVESKGIPIVSPSATSSVLSRYSWSRWLFRVTPDDSLQGGVVAKLIKDRGLKKVATLAQDSVYGRGVEEMAREYLKGRAEIVISLRYDPAKLSYMAELNSIKEKQPDCVLHIGYYDDGAVIYRQAGQLGMDNIAWMAVDGVYDMPLERYLEAAKFMEKAVTGTVPTPDFQSDTYKKFSDSYKNTYGFAPTIYCDTTYDGINLIALALQKANIYHGPSLRDELAQAGKEFHGASGSVTFDQSGSRIAGNYGIWKVRMEGTQYQFVLTGEPVSFLKPR